MGIDQEKREQLLAEMASNPELTVFSDELLNEARERLKIRKENEARKKEEDKRLELKRLEELQVRAALPENQSESLADFFKRLEKSFEKPSEFHEQATLFIINNWEILVNNLVEDSGGKAKKFDLIYKLMEQYLFQGVAGKMSLSFNEASEFLTKYCGKVFDEIVTQRSGYVEYFRNKIMFIGLNPSNLKCKDYIEVSYDTKKHLIIENILEFCGIEQTQQYILLDIFCKLENLIEKNLVLCETANNKIVLSKLQLVPKVIVDKYLEARQIDLESFKRNCEEVVLSRQGVEQFLEWCLYIFIGTKRKIVNNESIVVLQKTEKAIDSSSKRWEVVFPDLKLFPKLSEKLRVYMVREGIIKKYHKVMKVGYEYAKKDDQNIDGEKEYFLTMTRLLNQEGISTIMKRLYEYEHQFGLFKGGKIFSPTKRGYRKEIEKIEIPDEIETFYKLARYFHKLFRIGAVYARTGREEMAESGELLMEIARMGMEYMHDIAVNIEAKLMDPDFADTELRRLFASLGSLIGGAELNRYLNGAALVHSDLLVIRSAQDEMAGGDEGVDFMKRLKALPPKEK